MKKIMKKALAFITFEQLVTKSQIELRFQHLRSAQQQQNITLDLIAAKHKLIYEYWVVSQFEFLFIE